MIALLQRVSHARVDIGGAPQAAIGRGVLALIGVRPSDGDAEAHRLLERMLHYRIFPGTGDRMDLSLVDIGGGLLLVPQFTLAADTAKGRRPGFSHAAPPDQARRLFDKLVALAQAAHSPVSSGVFAADMQVCLTNDGPVTIWLEA
ncbi:MAG: D-tyrosyl-tRNA(Tyr) deacylase [Steroidobacteraceae bacterium]|nr:D-tyrosyl-tRNA(Tyr) deacylase [Steroidobacteraceae bacterium]